MNLRMKSLITGLCLAWALPVHALSLLEGYRLAKTRDPVYRAAQAEREAGEANRALGRAQLLPVIAASGSRMEVEGDQRYPSTNPPTSKTTTVVRELDYVSKNGTIQLRQPIFNLQRWAEYRQGQLRADYSEAVFSKKEKDLAVRYLTAYLDVLLARETLALAEAKVSALKEQQAQTDRQFELGDGTLTDKKEVEARLSLAQAQVLEAQDQFGIASRTLGAIIGEAPSGLHQPRAENLAQLRTPPAETLQRWLELAVTNSPDLHASQKNVELSKQEITKARSGHFPTIDFIASRSHATSESITTIDQRTLSNSIGFQVNIPIFAGGSVSAQTDQARARLTQAQFELDNVRSQIELEVNKQYAGVVNGIAKTEALLKAVASSEEALKASRIGFRAGVRTTTDILNAEEQRFTARRELAQASYGMLASWIRLRATSGTLLEEDLVRLDDLFRRS